ncbi:MAG: hypothetical protein ABSD47_01110 [Candidatus Methylomirabilota bacterium]|jgi:phage gpG-like protein
MPFNLHVSLGNLDPVRERFEGFDARLRANLIRAVRHSALDVERRAKELVSGPVLRVRTGTLRRSISSRVEPFEGGVRGIISASAPYAATHELGLTLHIPEIRPVRAKALHFFISGGHTGYGAAEVFAMRARAHDVKMPERPFMRRALQEMAIQVRARIRQAVLDAAGAQP